MTARERLALANLLFPATQEIRRGIDTAFLLDAPELVKNVFHGFPPAACRGWSTRSTLILLDAVVDFTVLCDTFRDLSAALISLYGLLMWGVGSFGLPGVRPF